jgi:hypothetical protein
MRGENESMQAMSFFVSLGAMFAKDYPLLLMKAMSDAALKQLYAQFDAIYSNRPTLLSLEKPIKTSLLQAYMRGRLPQ